MFLEQRLIIPKYDLVTFTYCIVLRNVRTLKSISKIFVSEKVPQTVS